MALASLPQYVWDAWLLSRFPGRTLEELDQIDVLRVLRAVRVQEIDRVEALRRVALQHAGQSRLSNHDWRDIRRHDRLLERYGGGADVGE